MIMIIRKIYPRLSPLTGVPQTWNTIKCTFINKKNDTKNKQGEQKRTIKTFNIQPLRKIPKFSSPVDQCGQEQTSSAPGITSRTEFPSLLEQNHFAHTGPYPGITLLVLKLPDPRFRLLTPTENSQHIPPQP